MYDGGDKQTFYNPAPDIARGRGIFGGMKTLTLIAATAALATAANAPAPTVELVAKTYTKSLTRVTEQPKLVAREFAVLCRPVAQAEVDKKYGQHSYKHVHYYRNELAKSADGKFAEGAVVVKEKLGRYGGKDAKVEAAAGMIKRAPGTSPKTGDWDFFWFEKGKVSTEGAQHCAGCHSGAKRDYVFSDTPKAAK